MPQRIIISALVGAATRVAVEYAFDRASGQTRTAREYARLAIGGAVGAGVGRWLGDRFTPSVPIIVELWPDEMEWDELDAA